jgi:hypothetical protein
MSGERMSTANPTVIDVILNIVDLSNGPSYKILEIAQAFFS